MYVESMAAIPVVLPRHMIAVVKTPNQFKWAVFECPCGHGHRLMLNLDKRHEPTWTLAQADPPSLRPSIDSQGQRRCHFWLREGYVNWVRERQLP
jgi:hypothetical protein